MSETFKSLDAAGLLCRPFSLVFLCKIPQTMHGPLGNFYYYYYFFIVFSLYN
jgi:hypothetical protein